MSLRNQARDLLFQDFLEKNLTKLETKNIKKKFGFEDLIQAIQQKENLATMMMCLSRNRFDFLNEDSKSIDQHMKVIQSYLPLESFFLFSFHPKTGNVFLKFAFPNKLQNDHKNQPFKISPPDLKEILGEKMGLTLKNKIIDHFALTALNLIPYRLVRHQLVGFLFYEMRIWDTNLQLENFWEILLNSPTPS